MFFHGPDDHQSTYWQLNLTNMIQIQKSCKHGGPNQKTHKCIECTEIRLKKCPNISELTIKRVQLSKHMDLTSQK